eukprot:NODE_5129_length_610_cov_313.643243.p1 GENE.NODE_5129_length_610_cov_313.643243~~NODE_5129_length_610_cov_313.643243.p1  ORF type:complete len:185 (+),score=42.52 NODE_5129_length_610_cov_313.643243:43-555(+)
MADLFMILHLNNRLTWSVLMVKGVQLIFDVAPGAVLVCCVDAFKAGNPKMLALKVAVMAIAVSVHAWMFLSVRLSADTSWTHLEFHYWVSSLQPRALFLTALSNYIAYLAKLLVRYLSAHDLAVVGTFYYAGTDEADRHARPQSILARVLSSRQGGVGPSRAAAVGTDAR